MKLQCIIQQSNIDLKREVEQLLEMITSALTSLPPEMYTYHAWVFKNLEIIKFKIAENLEYLNLGKDIILPDILNQTTDLSRYFSLLNQRFVNPILRFRIEDCLCLKVLHWLHLSHFKTKMIPVAVIDGDFASLPNYSCPTIYYIPSSIQSGLLYLPLLFHEFGHLLYVCHKAEMNDLVYDLQEKVSHFLEPASLRDDVYAQEETKRRNAIVETWFEWTQELFCDAVGFVIGGPAFLHAFSMYLRTRGRGQFHRPFEKLVGTEHPVTWLRIKLLAERARKMSCISVADELEETWREIAEVLKVEEDYYGFYNPELLPAIQETIEDMLTEASPRYFTEEDLSLSVIEIAPYLPIKLINQAWQQFLSNPQTYPVWERDYRIKFLSSC